jgi:uncharacterized iron-regulated membrane protein
MKKNTQLNQWLWKWHIVGGLISLPFMLLLAVTGVIYLFKADVNQHLYEDTMFVEVPSASSQPISYASQLTSAQNAGQGKVVGMTVSAKQNRATEFKIKGQGRATNVLYVNPHNGEITGKIEQKETFMYLVRKLHGEILLNKVGTLAVELIASWFIVLILTGLYIWWPKQGSGAAGFFIIRTTKGRRIFWRDMHAVTGFWLSAFMLAVVAGGMPWTDVFGSNLKWVQKQTNSGYPQNWQNAKGLESVFIQTNITQTSIQSLDLDKVISIAETYQLPGTLSINLPVSKKGVYTIKNRALWLEDQQVIHIDQYSGNVVAVYNWNDVGILMETRQIFMRFHQGEYGLVNWLVMLGVGLAFIVMTSAGLTSYLMRKSKGNWSIPQVPPRFNVDKTLILMIIVLGLLFPMFGGSLVLLWLWDKRHNFMKKVF